MKKLRYRTKFLLGGSLFVIFALFMTDPDMGLLRQLPIGASTVASIMLIAKGLMAVALSHYAYKAMYDYDESDGRALFRRALEGNQAAAEALKARAYLQIALMFLFIWSGS